jgi:NAD(P)-dependent dehydrogenase (short-subunit alcohol dehydrogenase family)
MDNGLLNGRVALVTGAAAGLGRAMAIGLLEAGARVVLTDRLAALQKMSRELERFSGRAVAVSADLTDTPSLLTLVDQAAAAFGAIDVLISNAGIGPGDVRQDFYENPIRFWEFDEKALRRFLEINTIAPFMLAALVAPGMLSRGRGCIINVTTSLGSMIRAGRAGYGGSKAALEAHTAVMAGDLAGSGVTANVLIPGGVSDTAMVPTGANFDRSNLLPPQAMAPPAVWLASDEARDVTGRRFLASKWDPKLPPRKAAEQAGAPIAWSQLEQQALRPAGFVDNGLS